MSTLKVKLLRDGAQPPRRATDGAAAYDVHALLDAPVTIPPGGRALLPTGIAIELPSPDTVALLFSRSGFGVKHGVSLANSVGVIDSDYRGEVHVGLINHGSEPFTVENGDRIAQLMITPVLLPDVAVCDELSDTARGAGGFGSTGVR